MEQLQHAIKQAGGVTALAKALGIAQPRVSNWLVRGVPDGWMTVLSIRWPMVNKTRKPKTQATEVAHG